MSEIFVAGDIHGNYQGLMESLNAAGWQEGDTIICVGDVTDRGKDNARTVSFLQEHECDVRLVQGNHELQHKKLLQYYHVLIKVPQIRLFAAGIFRTYKAGYTYPKTKEELKEYEYSAEKQEETERLESAIDGIRNRFGYYSVQRAVMYKDRFLSHCDAKGNHTIHPHGYLQGSV